MEMTHPLYSRYRKSDPLGALSYLAIAVVAVAMIVANTCDIQDQAPVWVNPCLRCHNMLLCPPVELLNYKDYRDFHRNQAGR